MPNPPKSDRLKKAEGNIGKHRKSAGVILPSDSKISPPPWLGPAARRIWFAEFPELQRAGIFRRLDRQAFGCLCDSIAQLQSAKRELRRQIAAERKASLLVAECQLRMKAIEAAGTGEVVEKPTPAAVKVLADGLLVQFGSGVTQQNPLIAIINREKMFIRQYTTDFGMNPAARNRLTVDTIETDSDAAYEALLSAPRDDGDDDESLIQ